MKIHQCTTPMLHVMVEALCRGGLAPPYTRMKLERYGLASALPLLDALDARALSPGAIAAAVELVLEERSAATTPPELVWTGPSVGLQRTRDTHVVVEDLFRRAKARVLLAGYVFYQGKKLFRSLEREGAAPLEVRVVLHVRRDEDPRDVRGRFMGEQWPSSLARPRIFFDPRAMQSAEGAPRPSMHAKAIVVDGAHALITSANFTEAAHRRNIEAGVLLHDAPLARAIEDAFEDLITHGHLDEMTSS